MIFFFFEALKLRDVNNNNQAVVSKEHLINPAMSDYYQCLRLFVIC